MLTTETHFVKAAPRSMTIAVFSPPLTNPSNKGIVFIIYSKNTKAHVMSIFRAGNQILASYQMGGKSVVFPSGWVFGSAMTSRGGA